MMKVVSFCSLGHQTRPDPSVSNAPVPPACGKMLKIGEKRIICPTLSSPHLWQSSAWGYKHVMTVFGVLASSVSSRADASWSSFPVLSSRRRHPGPCYASEDTWCDLCGPEEGAGRGELLRGWGLAGVTLTGNRGEHVGVSGKPDSQKPVSPSPPPSLPPLSLWFNGLGVFRQQSGWYIWVINTRAFVR